MKDFISSVFFHEIKNSLSSVKFGIEMFSKYEMSKSEKTETLQNLLLTINNTMSMLEEYLKFMKFQMIKKLSYEDIELYDLLQEINKELTPLAKEKNINIYIPKVNIKIYSNKFWLKRAIYNIVFNAIKYNTKMGSIKVKLESNTFGVYISISDTGIGIEKKKLKSIFKFFEQIDENSNGFGIGLALSKSIVESFGGQITVKSNTNIGSDFILYLPKYPKEVTYKKLAIGIVAASVVLFFGISYFPIYSQNYITNINGGYISYKFEDGTICKVAQNSNYELKAKKNLYNTTFILNASLQKGDLSLKAIKNKATIDVNNREFNNLGTDFEIIRDKYTKVAVFDGKVKSDALLIDKGQGLVIKDKIKMVKLLSSPTNLIIKNDKLSFRVSPKALKYKIIISSDKEFINISNSFFTTSNQNIKLFFGEDKLYFIKVYAYDKYGLPSMPEVMRYVSLKHYNRALELINTNLDEAIIELESSISTIKDASALPYYKLSQIWFSKKQYKKSLSLINKALQIDKKREYYYLLFDNYQKLGKINKIKNEIDKVLSVYPNDTHLSFFKAKILFIQSKYKQANKILFKILQQDPKYKPANLLMIKVLEKLGQKESVKYYKGQVK